ncbi:MAG TPA: hypothetical protein VNM92_04825 [Thermoanaerobaculia bacterium]|nr:hypothetical protein [Thermoanaerobaculia bacterium]
MRQKYLLLAVMTLLLAGCGALGGLGGLGALGGILGSPGSDTSSDIRGTVDRIDTNAQRIDLDVQYVNNLRDARSDSSIYYDSQTRVEYDGKTHRPEDLERGDEISVRGANRSGRYVAETVTVTRNARRD